MKLYESEEYIYHKIPIRIYHHTLEQEGIYSPLHWHRSVELDLAVCGRIFVTMNGMRQEMKAGEWILVRSGELHSFTFVEHDDSYEGFTILIARPFLDTWLGGEVEYLAYPKDPEGSQQIAEMLQKFVELQKREEQTSEAEQMEYLFCLVKLLTKYCLDETIQVGQSNKDNIENIKNIINYIDLHYAEPISLASVAEKFHYSQAHLSRMFKKHIGHTFYAYLQDVRLLNAVEQMKKSKDISLIDCASKNGFPNVKSFITTFKKQYKCTPSEWRKSRT